MGTSRSVVLWNLLLSSRATVPGLNLNLKPEIVALISTSSSSSPLARVRQGHRRKRKIIQQRFQDIKGDSRRVLAPDGELEVARRDPPSLQVLRRVTRQLQDLGEKDLSTNLFFTLGFLPTSAVRYSRMAAV